MDLFEARKAAGHGEARRPAAFREKCAKAYQAHAQVTKMVA